MKFQLAKSSLQRRNVNVELLLAWRESGQSIPARQGLCGMGLDFGAVLALISSRSDVSLLQRLGD